MEDDEDEKKDVSWNLVKKIYDNDRLEVWLCHDKKTERYLEELAKLQGAADSAWKSPLQLFKKAMAPCLDTQQTWYPKFSSYRQLEKELHQTHSENLSKKELKSVLFYLDPQAAIKEYEATKIYSQADFEQENASFEKIYTSQFKWNPFVMYFCAKVYMEGDHSIEKCIFHAQHPEPLIRLISVAQTNSAIKVLNIYLRDPLQNVGTTSSGEQINRIYQHIMNLPPELPHKYNSGDDVVVEGTKEELTKRLTNILCTYYRKELFLLQNWLVKTNREQTLQEAFQSLVNKNIGSITYALGLEIERVFLALFSSL